jgi:deazaflavin-dependent oxidoreductase (nitroreductase family)
VPIACYPYQDSVVVVASNNGMDQHPLWWLNLEANPKVFVQLGTERYEVVAEALKGEEREVFLPTIYSINPRQKSYAEMTERILPVIYLKRI